MSAEPLTPQELDEWQAAISREPYEHGLLAPEGRGFAARAAETIRDRERQRDEALSALRESQAREADLEVTLKEVSRLAAHGIKARQRAALSSSGTLVANVVRAAVRETAAENAEDESGFSAAEYERRFVVRRNAREARSRAVAALLAAPEGEWWK